MHTQINDNINKKNNDLTLFLNSEDDCVFYTGHASILVRLNNKKYLFDFINNTNFYGNSWIFFPNQIMDNRLYNVDGVFVSGDVHDFRYRQAVSAAGHRCEAAIDVEKYIEINGL